MSARALRNAFGFIALEEVFAEIRWGRSGLPLRHLQRTSPGPALGSLPSVALSSGQAVYINTQDCFCSPVEQTVRAEAQIAIPGEETVLDHLQKATQERRPTHETESAERPAVRYQASRNISGTLATETDTLG